MNIFNWMDTPKENKSFDILLSSFPVSFIGTGFGIKIILELGKTFN